MSRTGKWIRNAVIGIVSLLVVLVIGLVIVVQTNWFRNYVREQIISATQDATGGRVELGAFNFDLSQLHATISGLVIHGNEPAGAAPFVSVASAEVRLRLLPGLKRLYEITYVGAERPHRAVHRPTLWFLPTGARMFPPRSRNPHRTLPDLRPSWTSRLTVSN